MSHTLISLGVLTACAAVVATAGAQVPAPAPVTLTPAPPSTPVPTTTAPQATPTTTAPAPTAPPVVRDAFSWAMPSRAALAAKGLWDPADDLSRDATRRDLARALMVLGPRVRPTPLPTDVAAKDPGAASIAAVVGQRWMTAPGGAFRPDEPVTARFAQTTVLRALGLRPAMAGLARVATADGRRLAVPAGFPAAVLARELGLRHNYPFRDDVYERPDSSPIRAADLVAMADRAGRLTLRDRSRASRYANIRLPAMTPAQRTVAEAALAQVGMPYVWGGDWPTASSPWGFQAQGGFDCSGLVWMAFKGTPSAVALGADITLRGRTADAMAFEAPAERVALSRVGAGDLVFFGDAGLRTTRGDVSHMGIALGGQWIIQSSGSRGGVTVSSLATYWTSGQARARRPALFGPAPPLAAAERRGLVR